ncbi:Trehalose/maltose import ATP-binding protein MalK [uncultured archaeon]|nr:Trehalose/maltose import ATP-binding protein MalK [uncultured archaeon]
MALLDIINLRTHFLTQDGLVKAVDTVDLTIAEGERLGLIGETGCGKTVLGMSIVRLLQPNTSIKGRIEYKGRDILKMKEAEMRRLRGREIAMILQNPTTSLNPVLKIGDQIAEAMQLHQGLDRREASRKAIEMLRSVHLPDAAANACQYPHELSGGMRERVMIALGLACNPEFIIADEPTKGLDIKTKIQIIELLREATHHKAMLMITHDLGVAGSICNKIAVMYAGELLEVAPSPNILNGPSHPYTQGFINSLPSRGLLPIPGTSPSLICPPSGCRFHPRCRMATKTCETKHPEMVQMEKGHFVRCLQFN